MPELKTNTLTVNRDAHIYLAFIVTKGEVLTRAVNGS
jgi:hypothetical protein